MAIDKKLQIFDSQGNPVDYDIMAGDVKFNDGKDLPTKLAEMEEEIGSGGYTPPQGGIPKTDLAPSVQTSLDKADTAYQKPASGIPASDIADGVIPDVSGLATKTEVAAKVDKVTGKGLSANDYTDADKAKVAASQSASQVQDMIDDALEDFTPGDIPEKVSDLENDEGFVTEEDFKTINNQSIVGSGNISIPKGDKGDAGNVVFEGLADLVALLVNDLTTGGAGNFLSAEMGKRLKQNVDAVQANILKLYNKLANMAFWDATDQAAAEPTALDWSVPKVTVTITNNIGSGAVIKRGGTVVSGSLQVDQGDELVLTVEPADADTELSNVTAAIDGGTASALTNNTLTIAHVNANTSIVFAGTAASSWDVAPKADVEESGTVVRYGMQQGRSGNPTTGLTTAGLIDNNTKPGVIMSPAGAPYPSGTNNRIFTSDAGMGNPGKTKKCFFEAGDSNGDNAKRYLNVSMEFNSSEDTSLYDYKVAVMCYTKAVIGNTSADTNISTVAGAVGRIQYRVGNSTMPTGGSTADGYSLATGDTFKWKFDLNAFAVDKGKAAGDIAYIKLLFCKYPAGTSTGLDSRTWIDNVTVRYKFTDD